jgi:hypothetical protein
MVLPIDDLKDWLTSCSALEQDNGNTLTGWGNIQSNED